MNIGIIPARWGSKRFPGKPLVDICGKPMVEWVRLAAEASALDRVVVAHDMESLAGKDGYVFVQGDFGSGTGRVAACARLLGVGESDLIVNIQGDEPCITPEVINTLLTGVSKFDDVGTLYTHASLVKGPDVVTIATDRLDYAMYFSRCAIPHGASVYRRHIGVYAYKHWALKEYIKYGKTIVEQLEGLEQLRWLDMGYGIKCLPVQYEGRAVDRADDVPFVEELLMSRELYERAS